MEDNRLQLDSQVEFQLESAISSNKYRGLLVKEELSQIRQGTLNPPPVDWSRSSSSSSASESDSSLEHPPFPRKPQIERKNSNSLSSSEGESSATSEDRDLSMYLLQQCSGSDSESTPHHSTKPPPPTPQLSTSRQMFGPLPPIPPTSNPLERLMEEEVPLHLWKATWLSRDLPTLDSRVQLVKKVEQMLQMPDSEEKDQLFQSLLPRPLHQTPIPGRFKFFPERWEKLGAHPWVVDVIRNGIPMELTCRKPPLQVLLTKS